MLKSRRTVFVAIGAAVFLALVQPANWAADAENSAEIGNLVWILERPAAPAKLPSMPESLKAVVEADLANWDTAKDEVWIKVRLGARKELLKHGAAAVQPLLGLLTRARDGVKDKDIIRIEVLTTFTLMDVKTLAPAAPALMDLLKDGNPGVQYLAAKILGLMRWQLAASEIEELAGSKEDALQLIAADSLGLIGRPASAFPLVKLLDDQNRDVRLHGIKALGTLGVALVRGPDGKVVDIAAMLIEVMRSEDFHEREAAIKALDAMVGYDLNSNGDWLLVRTKGSGDRKPVIDKLAAWWQQVLKTDQRLFARDPELSLRVSIALDQNLSEEVRLKALDLVRRIELQKPELKQRLAVNHLPSVMLTTNKKVRARAAEVATELSRIKIQYDPRDSEAQWFLRVGEFRKKWEDLIGK